MHRTISTWAASTAVASAILLSMCGCAREKQKQPDAAHGSVSEVQSVTNSPVSNEPAAAQAATTNARNARQPKDLKQAPPASATAAAFVGPFRHRTNPFALPNANKAATAAKQRVSEKRSDERLLGFVNVDGRKALLQIDGKVWAARQGETRSGIEVVEIAPAHVTLRRDGTTWNVTLMTSNHSS